MTATPPARTISLGVIELYRGTNPARELLGCSGCRESDDACELVARACRCGADRPASSMELYDLLGYDEESELMPIVFRALDPNYRYCVRLLGIDASSSATEDADCTCPENATEDLENTRVCAESLALAPSQASENLVIDEPLCEGDFGDGGVTSFSRCIHSPEN